MKKTLIAAATLCAFTGAASAQSSVTLYGVLDQGIGWTNSAGGGKQIGITDGNLQGSRWGLRGAEDLGAGLKAIFALESGFNVSDGRLTHGGALFGRQAFVGLSSATAGTVTLGRQYDSLTDYVGPFAMGSQWAGATGAHPFDFDNLHNSRAANGALKYTSLNYSGFTFGGTVSPNGVTGHPTKNIGWSVGAGFADGPLQLGIAYLRSKDPSYSVLAQPLLTPINQFGPEDSSRHATLAAGGSYAFGPAVIGLTYSRTQDEFAQAVPGNVPESTLLRAQNGEISLRYQMTPALLAGAGYGYTKMSRDGQGNHLHQVSLGTVYSLSKRTAVYASGSFQRANAGHKAALYSLDESANNRQIAVRVGVRHRF
ncbi:porin [Robbsia sp. Bb-Pol-6]|uniref:Porin n=1 Tax=Robbsia betulipollinis TaxID=2981849 RepID=A0ABT3ZQG6_9BURK|nr:porin [Robbsia betulipollinis]MCY0388793.1 porin [Robbsia betulipollinis]